MDVLSVGLQSTMSGVALMFHQVARDPQLWYHLVLRPPGPFLRFLLDSSLRELRVQEARRRSML